MQILENSVEETSDLLRRSSHAELREVDCALRRLSRKQILFVHDTLESARREELLPPHNISFMEFLLQEWWEHSLATKLTLLTRIVGLSQAGSWPGHTPGDRVINDRIENLLGVTTR